jgi:hypothetical protein
MSDQSHQMKWILFWTFLILFVLMVLGTLCMVFFGFGSPTENERELMVKGLIGEVAACIIALFYSIFGINKKNDPTEINEIKGQIHVINNNIETLNSRLEEKVSNVKINDDKILSIDLISKYKEIIGGFDSPPPFATDAYTLIPLADDIKKDVDNAKPFDKKHREGSYTGIKIQWKVIFCSIREVDNCYNITIRAGESLLNVSFNIKKSNGQIFKTLDNGTPFWICGTVKSVDSLWLVLEDVNVDI